MTLTNLHVFVDNSTTRWFCETSIPVLSIYNPAQCLLNEWGVNEDVGSRLVEALCNKCTQPAHKWVKSQVRGHDSWSQVKLRCVWRVCACACVRACVRVEVVRDNMDDGQVCEWIVETCLNG